MIASMSSNSKMSKKGEVFDAKNINVNVLQRSVHIKCNNGWMQIGERKTSALKSPDQFGIYSTDQVITISDYVPHEYVALIFELEFEVQIQGYERKTVCLGF